MNSDDEASELNFHDSYSIFKICVIGDGSVGKTSLILRFTQDAFNVTYKQTTGLDFFNKRITVVGTPVDKNNSAGDNKSNATTACDNSQKCDQNFCQDVDLQIWDIGGQQLGSSMLRTYIYGSDVVLLVYDITNYHSFLNLNEWLQLVLQTFDTDPTDREHTVSTVEVEADENVTDISKHKMKLPYIAIVGNKTDLMHLKVVKYDSHNAFVKAYGFRSFFISAKTGHDVYAMFHKVACDIMGLKVTKTELDQSLPKNAVTANIIDYDSGTISQNKSRKENAKKGSTITRENSGQKRKSSICRLM